MPSNVLEEFQRDGCTVAQSNFSSTPHNVLHGTFAAPGQVDWMAACKLADGRVQAQFVWGGEHRCDTPLANDMVMHLSVNESVFLMVPYLTIASAREGQTHQRILQRWTPTGVWSYYCNDGKWEKTPGDSCTKTSRDEVAPSSSQKLLATELQRRRDIKSVAAAELAHVIEKQGSRKIEITAANADCRPIGSLKQICFFGFSGETSINANVIVERVGKEAWFATKLEATICQLQ